MPGSYAQYQLSVFAPELMGNYGLSTSQFSSIFTSPMIVAIFLRNDIRGMVGNGDWQEGERFRSGVSAEDVQSWVEGLGM